MLRFPTTIPIRPAEFDEFKEAILSQRLPQSQAQSTTTHPSNVDQSLVDRERVQVQERQNKSKSQRIGLGN